MPAFNAADLERARRVARDRGYTEERCKPCGGSRVLRDDDANAPTGVRTIDPCPACDGYGVVWYEGPTPTIVNRMTVKELFAS